MIPRILLINDNRKAGGLTLALRRRGAQVTVAPLSAVKFDSGTQSGLVFPGLGKRLPDGVFVRSMSAGTFEAITRRLGVLHALERLKVPVWNPAHAIERCVDKSATTFLLQAAGLPTPQTVVVEGLDAARDVAHRELAYGPLVLKPLFGAQGIGIRSIDTVDSLPAEAEVAGVYYLQRMVARRGPPFADYRVFVSDGRAIATMRRVSASWITNVNRGAVPEAISGELEIERLGIAAAQAVGTAFAGVDVIVDDDGKAFVIEVNSMPAWSGLQSVASVNIADELAGAFLAAVRDRAQLAVRPKRLVAPANG